MWRKLFNATMAFGALAASAATAETACGPRAGMLQGLTREYGETPVARALAGPGQMIEVLVSPSGSWTMIVSDVLGQACIVGTGEAWTAVPRPTPAAIERPA
jgi:hypothetical protein